MALGESDPTWRALQKSLRDVVRETFAAFAAVIDTSNALWCISERGYELAADRFYQDEIAHRRNALIKRGARVRIHRDEPPDRAYYAVSFGSIYILVVSFRDTVYGSVHARVRDALPRIEALTLALPPPGGPDAGAASGKMPA